ncbi:MAG TPA: hypothetical protein VK392_11780 [Thermoanaerobaculia bacterium]|nr:hypothetical protein [Thermoanaerobaculia bacterium]
MKTSTKTLLASASVLSLTMLHHFYGAVLYDSPWRNHVAVVALPVLLALVVTHEIHSRRPSTPLGRTSLFLFAALTLAVPVGMIGIFEGGYNHLVKDLLFFGGLPAAALDRLFPDSVYEMPDDLLFEASGVLQFFLGLYTARSLARLWRERALEQSGRTEEDRQAA